MDTWDFIAISIICSLFLLNTVETSTCPKDITESWALNAFSKNTPKWQLSNSKGLFPIIDILREGVMH